MSGMQTHLSEEFLTRIRGTFGEAGEVWLSQLPTLLDQAAERWSIEIEPPFQPLSYNYVAPATGSDGEAVVLKCGVPNRELTSEIAALRCFAGQGAVELLEGDADAGLLLLERLEPGEPLARRDDDDAATLVFADVAKSLWRTAPKSPSFPTVQDWAKGFARLRERYAGQSTPISKTTLDRAEKMMADLLKSTTTTVLLHGDLHHWNILSAKREPWLALDPKGVIGPPEYEVGAWLRNPSPQVLSDPQPRRLFTRRIDMLAERLGFERQRLEQWAYCQAILSAIWSIEEGDSGWREMLNWAKAI